MRNRRTVIVLAITLLAALSHRAQAQGTNVTVQLDASKAGPRAVEDQTRRRIIADYRFAWANLAHAVDVNAVDALQGLFVGPAKKQLTDTVISERQSDVHTRYLNQNHKVDAVFYAPEGDVMELHDTAEYQLQILDGSKIVHDDHVAMHYIVLMTPGADRWVVRQLQSVDHF